MSRLHQLFQREDRLGLEQYTPQVAPSCPPPTNLKLHDHARAKLIARVLCGSHRGGCLSVHIALVGGQSRSAVSFFCVSANAADIIHPPCARAALPGLFPRPLAIVRAVRSQSQMNAREGAQFK